HSPWAKTPAAHPVCRAPRQLQTLARTGAVPSRSRRYCPPRRRGCCSLQRAFDHAEQLGHARRRVIAHVSEANRRFLELAVARTDHPALFFRRVDDGLGGLPLGQLEAGHRPRPLAGLREIRDTERGALVLDPAFHDLAHGIVTTPA